MLFRFPLACFLDNGNMKVAVSLASGQLGQSRNSSRGTFLNDSKMAARHSPIGAGRIENEPIVQRVIPLTP